MPKEQREQPSPDILTDADIALWATHSPVSAAIRWKTKQSVSHAGLISMDEDTGLPYIIHAKYGWYFGIPSVIREPLSNALRGLTCIVRVRPDLFHSPVQYVTAVNKVSDLACTYVGKRYDWKSIAGITLDTVGLGRLIPDSRERVMCSELVSEVWSSAFPFDDNTSIFANKPHSRITPGDLLESLITEEVWHAQAT